MGGHGNPRQKFPPPRAMEAHVPVKRAEEITTKPACVRHPNVTDFQYTGKNQPIVDESN